jgi:hypothetical protein
MTTLPAVLAISGQGYAELRHNGVLGSSRGASDGGIMLTMERVTPRPGKREEGEEGIMHSMITCRIPWIRETIVKVSIEVVAFRSLR